MNIQEMIEALAAKKEALDANVKAGKILQEEYNELETKLVGAMLRAGVDTAGSGGLTFKRTIKFQPKTTSWEDLYTHVAATGEFDLLHKRLSSTACNARWGEEHEIPGVEKYRMEKWELSNK